MFTWHDEKSRRLPKENSLLNYDLTYKSIRWMYTVAVSDVKSASTIKTFSMFKQRDIFVF